MKRLKLKGVLNILCVLTFLPLMSCSMLSPLPAIPNPLEADKGINTNVALGKNVEANNTKGLVTLDKIDIGRDNSNTSNNASSMTNNYTNINWWLIGILILLGGMAIPTRGQANRIKELKENLEYERARTNLVVEATAERQKPRPAQNI